MFWHASQEEHQTDPVLLSKETKAAVIIDRLDELRISFFGGYPSVFAIENGRLYWATLDEAKEYNAPALVISNVDEFVDEHDWVLEEWECDG